MNDYLTCWQVLGIQPTADKKSIKQAYASQLKTNKPDKNPVGFKTLRQAYEQALEDSQWYQTDTTTDVDTDTAELNTTDEQDRKPPPLEKDEIDLAMANKAVAFSSGINDDDIAQRGTDLETADISVPTIKDFSLPLNAKINDTKISENDASIQDEITIVNGTKNIEIYENPLIDVALSDWQQMWDECVCNQALSDNKTSLANKDNTNINQDNQDERLLTLLRQQTQQLDEYPLDTRTDFEKSLLIWLLEQLPQYPQSYEFSKTYFSWQTSLNEWQEDYPWYLLPDLDTKYQNTNYFKDEASFLRYLRQYYPKVAEFWVKGWGRHDNQHMPNHQRFRLINRMRFLYQYLLPISVLALAKQTHDLQQTLAYHSYLHVQTTQENSPYKTADFWRTHPQMISLNRWLFHNFIQPADFARLAFISFLFILVAKFIFKGSWSNYFADFLGVFTVLTLGYVFWQAQIWIIKQWVQLEILADADKDETWKDGWIGASILMYILALISWFNTAQPITDSAPDTPVYYLAHLAGLSLALSISAIQKEILVTDLTWHASLALAYNAMVLPFLVWQIAPILAADTQMSVLPQTPLLWLFVISPMILFKVATLDIKLNFVMSLASIMLMFVYLYTFISVFLICIYAFDILFDLNLYLTGFAIILFTLWCVLNVHKLSNLDDKLLLT